MAVLHPLAGEVKDAFESWLATRPQDIQDLARRYPPGVLYMMKSSGHRVTIIAYAEDGTVRVNVGDEYNFVAFPREVFGVNPEDLEECDLPGPDEPVGSLCKTDEEIAAHLKHMKHILGHEPCDDPRCDLHPRQNP